MKKNKLPYELHRGDSMTTLLSACAKAQNHKSAESKTASNVETKKHDDNANRVTYDLAFVEAHEPVHTIQYLDGDTYVFDKSGNIVTFNGYAPFTADVYGQPEKLLNKLTATAKDAFAKLWVRCLTQTTRGKASES